MIIPSRPLAPPRFWQNRRATAWPDEDPLNGRAIRARMNSGRSRDAALPTVRRRRIGRGAGLRAHSSTRGAARPATSASSAGVAGVAHAGLAHRAHAPSPGPRRVGTCRASHVRLRSPCTQPVGIAFGREATHARWEHPYADVLVVPSRVAVGMLPGLPAAAGCDRTNAYALPFRVAREPSLAPIRCVSEPSAHREPTRRDRCRPSAVTAVVAPPSSDAQRANRTGSSDRAAGARRSSVPRGRAVRSRGSRWRRAIRSTLAHTSRSTSRWRWQRDALPRAPSSSSGAQLRCSTLTSSADQSAQCTGPSEAGRLRHRCRRHRPVGQ